MCYCYSFPSFYYLRKDIHAFRIELIEAHLLYSTIWGNTKLLDFFSNKICLRSQILFFESFFSSHFQPAGELSTLSCVAFECIQPIVTAWPLPNKYLGPAEVVSLVAVEQLGQPENPIFAFQFCLAHQTQEYLTKMMLENKRSLFLILAKMASSAIPVSLIPIVKHNDDD